MERQNVSLINEVHKLFDARVPAGGTKRHPENRGEWLRELAAEGLEQRIRELHIRYRRGDISFGRFAEETGLNVWELTRLLDNMGLPATNLPSN